VVLGAPGLIPLQFGRGLWLMESGWLAMTGVQTYAWLWVIGVVFLWFSLNARTLREDELMRKQFGETWKLWAAKVPYRLVPGVI